VTTPVPPAATVDPAALDVDWEQLSDDDSAAFMRAWYELGG
jgi:hypothetical protein